MAGRGTPTRRRATRSGQRCGRRPNSGAAMCRWTVSPDDALTLIEGRAARATAPVEDHDFVAHARQDVPRLVAEVRRLRSTLDVTSGQDSAAPTTYTRPWWMSLWKSSVRSMGDAPPQPFARTFCKGSERAGTCSEAVTTSDRMRSASTALPRGTLKSAPRRLASSAQSFAASATTASVRATTLRTSRRSPSGAHQALATVDRRDSGTIGAMKVQATTTRPSSELPSARRAPRVIGRDGRDVSRVRCRGSGPSVAADPDGGRVSVKPGGPSRSDSVMPPQRSRMRVGHHMMVSRMGVPASACGVPVACRCGCRAGPTVARSPSHRFRGRPGRCRHRCD